MIKANKEINIKKTKNEAQTKNWKRKMKKC
jgi:hypothetical protein